MGDRLKALKEKSQERRKLLALQFGVSDPNKIGQVLRGKEEKEELESEKKEHGSLDPDQPQVKKAALDVSSPYSNDSDEMLGDCDVDDEDREAIFIDSSAFLKGTQSANPHNDYSQNCVDTGERPQNFIRDVGLANRFEEYPKLRELIRLKDELIQKTNTPPMYLKCDLETFDLRDLECKFDVILLEPPLEEYQRSLGVHRDKYWSWDEIEQLEIEQVADTRSFIWIWCGSSDGLDAGRRCLKKWGFRRCEDICWIKTNIKNPGHIKNLEPKSIFQRTKEHCLMGIKGTVRRSTDGDFIHANVDIDLIIEESKPHGSDEKPVEIFHVIEHFCLGRRRLHIFGRDSMIRPGWLSIGPDLTTSNFDPEMYNSFFTKEPGYTTGCTEEIERLRPKSPPPKIKGGAASSSGSRGGSMRTGLNARGGASGSRGGAMSGWQGRGRSSNRGGYRGRGSGAHRQGPPPR